MQNLSKYNAAKVKIFFYHKKLELLEITEKETAKTTPNIEKICVYIFIDNICSVCSPVLVVTFGKNILIL